MFVQNTVFQRLIRHTIKHYRIHQQFNNPDSVINSLDIQTQVRRRQLILNYLK